jgi:hypothetical protein
MRIQDLSNWGCIIYFGIIFQSISVIFLICHRKKSIRIYHSLFIIPPLHRRGVYCFTSVRPSVLPSVQDIFFSNYWWQKSDIWSQASYRYAILWEAFLDPSDSYFLFADLVGFYTHLTYMHIFRHIFLSNYWWQKSDIWSQASYGYPISWEVFLDPSDSYFLFVDFVDFYTHWTYILYMGDFKKNEDFVWHRGWNFKLDKFFNYQIF